RFRAPAKGPLERSRHHRAAGGGDEGVRLDGSSRCRFRWLDLYRDQPSLVYTRSRLVDVGPASRQEHQREKCGWGPQNSTLAPTSASGGNPVTQEWEGGERASTVP